MLLAKALDRRVFENLVMALAGHPASWEERDTLEWPPAPSAGRA